TRGNSVLDTFEIKLIVYGLLALLQLTALSGAQWTLAEVFVAAASLYYLTLAVPLGLTMLAEAVALDLIPRFVADWRIWLAAFVAGWIFQGIGHARYEKKSPAFFKNLLHLLVGPIFLWNELLHVRRIDAR